MMKPIIVVNLKTYKQGKKAIKLAKEISKVSKEVIVGVQAADVYETSWHTRLRVYAQHVDHYEPGRNTGYILPESIKQDGAVGTFLNHSEHKLNFDVLKKTIARCKKLKLRTMVFASSLNEAVKIRKLKPDYIIIEPPSLIAGKKSVSEAKPGLIRDIAKKLKYRFLVGAGVHSKEDLEIAMRLGASGIALSSAITTSKNPGQKLREIIS